MSVRLNDGARRKTGDHCSRSALLIYLVRDDFTESLRAIFHCFVTLQSLGRLDLFALPRIGQHLHRDALNVVLPTAAQSSGSLDYLMTIAKTLAIKSIICSMPEGMYIEISFV